MSSSAGAPSAALFDELPAPAERRAASFAAGWSEGFRSGSAAAAAAHAGAVAEDLARRAEATRRCEQLAITLAGIVAAAEAAARATAAAAVRDTAEAALELTEAIVGHELRHSTAPVRDAVARALAELPVAGVELRVNPADLDLLAAVPAGATVVDDPAVEPGGCVARAGAATVDAQVGSALARVAEVLRGRP